MGGKCGICGDPWDADPRQHEAGGRFANGIIVRTYRPGADLDVEVDVTANHYGFFTFKLCVNNDTVNDPGQDCFDKSVDTICIRTRVTFVFFIILQCFTHHACCEAPHVIVHRMI